MASTASSFSATQTLPTSPETLGSKSIPEVLAQTPQGTVVNWEELFEVILHIGHVILLLKQILADFQVVWYCKICRCNGVSSDVLYCLCLHWIMY